MFIYIVLYLKQGHSKISMTFNQFNQINNEIDNWYYRELNSLPIRQGLNFGHRQAIQDVIS